MSARRNTVNRNLSDSAVYHSQSVARVKNLSDKELKKLFFLSTGVEQFCIFLLFSLFCTVAMAMPVTWPGQPEAATGSPGAIMASLVTLSVVVVGGFRRNRLGYFAGIGLCLLLVAVFPVGTVFGLIGLILYIKSARLFGRNAIPHSQLRQEYAWRRRRAEAATA